MLNMVRVTRYNITNEYPEEAIPQLLKEGWKIVGVEEAINKVEQKKEELRLAELELQTLRDKYQSLQDTADKAFDDNGHEIELDKLPTEELRKKAEASGIQVDEHTSRKDLLKSLKGAK